MQYEMIRYILGGVCTTLVNVGMFSLLRYGVGLELQVANGISILTAILFAFGINRTFVFQKEGKAGVWKEWIPVCRDARSFYGSGIVGNVPFNRKMPYTGVRL